MQSASERGKEVDLVDDCVETEVETSDDSVMGNTPKPLVDLDTRFFFVLILRLPSHTGFVLCAERGLSLPAFFLPFAMTSVPDQDSIAVGLDACLQRNRVYGFGFEGT